jgi:predicted dinucleotide-binding enzyme
MKIGIIGTGVIGKTLARKLAVSGNQVRVANSRGPESLVDFASENGLNAVTCADAVKDVEVIILTIPLGQLPKIKEIFVGVPEDVIVVETMNYYPYRDGAIEEIENGMVNSVWVQNQIGRPVIKAFNSIGAYSLFAEGTPKGTPNRIALPVAGDNQIAKEKVIELVNQTGFDGFDAGSISESWKQQPGTPVYCTDLTMNEAKQALGKAIKEDAPAARDFFLKKLSDVDEAYMNIILTGNYPDGFVDKGVDMNREYFGFPQRNIK